MSKEDTLAQDWIDRHKDYFSFDAQPEVHYNYYGDRGVVDLVTEYKICESDIPELHILEFKSPESISNVTGANEIIRQYNRHKKYFFTGSDYSRREYFGPTFFLMFWACEDTINHVFDNKELYLTCIDRPGDLTEVSSTVCFYHPSLNHVIHLDYPKQFLESSLTEVVT